MEVKNIARLGDKDTGNSTLIGYLLILSGSVSKDRIADARRASRKFRRGFEPGFILDSFSEEQEAGMTIDASRAQILHGNTAFELIDVPGHEELIKNMISGASYAEIAVVLVSVKKGEGISNQTMRHIFLAKMLGIRRIIVAVNKIDVAGYDAGVFKKTASKIGAYLSRIGFSKNAIDFVPISAYNGDNIISRSMKTPWYRGKVLIKCIAAGSVWQAGYPLRTVVQDTIERDGENLVAGQVISGSINKGDIVVTAPAGKRRRVLKIVVKAKEVKTAKEGESVALGLDGGRIDLHGEYLISGKGALRSGRNLSATIFAVRKPGQGLKIVTCGVEIPCEKINVNKCISTADGLLYDSESIVPMEGADVRIHLKWMMAYDPSNPESKVNRFLIMDRTGFAGIGVLKS